MKRALTPTEMTLLDKCQRYRRALTALLYLIPAEHMSSLEYIAAIAVLGERDNDLIAR